MLLTAGPLGDVVPLRTAGMLELGHVGLMEFVRETLWFVIVHCSTWSNFRTKLSLKLD